MAQLMYKNKVILDDMKYATSTFAISKGLMFASRKKIQKGICLVMPTKKDVRFGSSVTMFFCFYPMQILFINSKFKVVDKVILKPWLANYTPKEKCKYVVEGWIGVFDEIKVGDDVKINV